MAKLEFPVAKGLFPNPRYSHTLVGNGRHTVYIAGQVAVDEHGKLVGGDDLGAQATQAMKNVGLALAAAGASYADIAKLTTYVVGYKPEHRTVVGNARMPFFGDGPPPASTLVGVAALALPEWLIEIEAIAVLD